MPVFLILLGIILVVIFLPRIVKKPRYIEVSGILTYEENKVFLPPETRNGRTTEVVSPTIYTLVKIDTCGQDHKYYEGNKWIELYLTQDEVAAIIKADEDGVEHPPIPIHKNSDVKSSTK